MLQSLYCFPYNGKKLFTSKFGSRKMSMGWSFQYSIASCMLISLVQNVKNRVGRYASNMKFIWYGLIKLGQESYSLVWWKLSKFLTWSYQGSSGIVYFLPIRSTLSRCWMWLLRPWPPIRISGNAISRILSLTSLNWSTQAILLSKET